MFKRSVAFALGLWGCHADSTVEAGPSAGAEVVFQAPAGEVTFTVEIADSPDERAMGLMNRYTLDAAAGMIFVFPSESIHDFWMKNTYISLDIIYLNAERQVIGIVDRATPLSETPVGVGQPSKFVIEIGAGLAAQHGITTGTPTRFVQVPDTTER
jgi:uncharacterized protein